MKKILFISIAMIGIGTSYVYAQNFDISKCNQEENEADCRKRLGELNQEIQILDGGIKIEDQNQAVIGQEINQLTGEIRKTDSEIKKKNSLIKNIKKDILDKEQNLDSLNARLRREKESLEKIIRKRHELEDSTLFEMLLSNESISEFYEDAPAFSYIQGSLSDSFEIIDNLKVEIYGEKQSLEEKQKEEDAAKYSLQIEQQKIETQKKQRDQALAASEEKEASLARLRQIRQQEAQEISNKLFELRDLAGGGIAFGDAYKYAKEAGGKTGVRPAFILAILEQESNMGKNVGTCNRNTNEPIWSDIMPGPTSGSWRDDQTIYKRLMAKLGRPLVGTPLSCPIRINGKPSGWGGAMGPSQFIPATWESYEDRIARAVGATTADPWNARHAIHATALYVSDLGAGAQTYSAEREAACKYYSGRGCSDPAVRNAFYGNGVMDRTIRIQANIDLID
ncbi:MAG: lytic murein transglycosylase [Candidatus Pacebacteria bacterium]|nr:lytic murein transglycosylase [Candidatus Paceibacterota bacterium]